MKHTSEEKKNNEKYPMHSVCLTAQGMSPDATEEDFDSYVSYVTLHLSDRLSSYVSVDSYPFTAGPGEDTVVSDREEEIRGVLQDLWIEWCDNG
jgi:selenophosphate synthase